MASVVRAVRSGDLKLIDAEMRKPVGRDRLSLSRIVVFAKLEDANCFMVYNQHAITVQNHNQLLKS